MKRVSEIAPLPLPVDVGASVRARIQERCAEAKSYKRGENLFYSVYGVDARKGWWGLRTDPLAPSSEDGFHDGADAFFDTEEGRVQLRIHLRRERSQELVSRFKESLSRLACCICEFDFGEFYGERGRGYIEAHHVIPVAKLIEGSRTQLADLVPVCANCHRMLHRNELLSWQDLKAVLQLRNSTTGFDSA